MPPIDLRNGLKYSAKQGRVDVYDVAEQTMVVVDVVGDPAVESARVLPALYGMAYGVRKLYKDRGQPFTVDKLRGRWPDAVVALPRAQWAGVYGLPVPDDLPALPDLPEAKRVPGVTPRLETWSYGRVAATLHPGDFSGEAATLDALHREIAARGLQALPDTHEEIYLSDPRKTPPDRWKTLLLRRVQAP
jgi:hypothetical protein